MSARYINQLIAQGEHQKLDFKFAITDSKKIARTLVAFANTAGGKLLIGVKDNGNIAGVRSEEEFYMVQAASQMYSKPEVFFESRQWTIDGKTVLEITVPESKTKPHLAPKDDKWLAYIRVNDQNLLANRIWLKATEHNINGTGILLQYTEQQKMLLTYLDENETITLSKFARIAFLPRFMAENILINLVALNIIEIVFTEKQTYYRTHPLFNNPKN